MDKSKAELLKQISAVDFSALDLHLYLNTHPMDRAALAQYDSCVEQGKMLKEKYKKHCEALTAGGEAGHYHWRWIEEPWPWEYDANYELYGEEK